MQFLKKGSILVYTLVIIFIFILILFSLQSKKEKENLNITPDTDESECYTSTEFKEKDEFLKEQYKNKKLVAITFDDGPSKYTEILVDELKKRNISATFFVLGSEVEKFPDTLKFENDAGNEIGIHSYKHQLFTKLSESEILEQVSKTKDLIYKLTGENPKLIRVPYGSINKNIKEAIVSSDLTSVLWNVDSLDWKFRNTENTYNYIMKKFKGNDIILMHDTFKTSIQTATLVIDTLESKCYTFVTVSEFFRIKSLVKN